ncbi:MAG: hypothetical protein LBU69_01240, partial [Deltaproteobacteria bacterium]|nr:hypothetical protein [Deltaproteobacteria bacterium]
MKNEIANTTTTHPLTLVEAAAPLAGSSGNDKPKSKRDHGSLDPSQNDGTFSFRSLFTVIWNLLLQVSKLKDVIKGLESKVEGLTKENARLKEKAQEPEKNPDNSSLRPSSRRYPQKKPPKLGENGKPIKGKPGRLNQATRPAIEKSPNQK